MLISEAKKLFIVHKDEEPEIKLHQMMNEASKGQGGRWDKEAGELKAGPQRMEKTEVQEVRIYLNIKQNVVFRMNKVFFKD